MKTISVQGIELLSFDLFEGNDRLFHGITTRHGGTSDGNYASFNLGLYAGDRPEAVEENRKRLCRILEIDPQHLLLPHQTHGTGIARIDQTFERMTPTERNGYLDGKDALICSLKKYGIGVTTADCVPVLIFDPVRQVVAAIHAGWRGTVARIVRRCVTEMERAFDCRPTDLLAGIGPSIGPTRFEVGNEVTEAFRTAGFPMEQIAAIGPGHEKYRLDLWEANRLELIEAGIPERQIETSGICTRTHHDRFFSARKLGVASGRFVSVIGLR